MACGPEPTAAPNATRKVTSKPALSASVWGSRNSTTRPASPENAVWFMPRPPWRRSLRVALRCLSPLDQVVRRRLRCAGRSVERSGILAENLDPRAQILGVILAWLRLDPEHRGDVGCGEFGYQLLACVRLATELA